MTVQSFSVIFVAVDMHSVENIGVYISLSRSSATCGEYGKCHGKIATSPTRLLVESCFNTGNGTYPLFGSYPVSEDICTIVDTSPSKFSPPIQNRNAQTPFLGHSSHSLLMRGQ